MPPKVMVLTPKKTLCLDSREEAELVRMALIEGGLDENDVVLAEQQMMFDDAGS